MGTEEEMTGAVVISVAAETIVVAALNHLDEVIAVVTS